MRSLADTTLLSRHSAAHPVRLCNVVIKTTPGRALTSRTSMSIVAPTIQASFDDLTIANKLYYFPTVFAKQLCIRPLLLKKRAICVDIPITLCQEWSDQMLETVVRYLTIPVKVADALAQGLRQVLRCLSIDNHGHLQNKQGLEENRDDFHDNAHETQERHNKLPRIHESAEHASQSTDTSWAALTISRMATFSLQNYTVK
ncbi:hypothetical protein ACA910_013227 [Epithemia clementina (nom. ined.)]